MKGVRAAVRYAKALMQLAQKQNKLDTIYNDVKLIHSAVQENKDLAAMLQNPLIKGEKKEAVLNAVFSGKVDELTVKFIQQLVAQGRENILALVSNDFIDQYNTLKNIARVSVTTPAPLTDALRAQVIEKITKEYNLAQVELEEKVDESIIGGMILRIGDRQLDASVRRQLNDIKQELIHA